MKTKLLFLFIFWIFNTASKGQTSELNKEQIKSIKNLVYVIKTNDKTKIADQIKYPLRREYPLHDVKDKNDLIKRFDEIFDREIMGQIAKSRMEDWTEVGWRGIMLGDGAVWIDDDGKIVAINHQSPKEKQLLVNAIQADKNQLPKSLQNFERAIYFIWTKNYKIRIDGKKEGSYRYAAWKIKDKRIEPDLMIENGVLEYQGSGGNHTITFKNNGHTYLITINLIGAEDGAEAVLEVLKEKRAILTESGVVKRN